MPTAKETFDSAINDAKELLDHFDKMNGNPPPANAEVLKRAGLIMALTAWETYVEDRILEAVHTRLGLANESFQNQFVLRHLRNALKSFNTPNVEKTSKLFSDYLGIEVSESWKWNNYEPERVKRELDALVKKRGEAVHRSKPIATGNPPPHLIKRDELEKAIRFLKSLVEATDKFTSQTPFI